MKQIASIYWEGLTNGTHYSLAKRLLEAALADTAVSEKAATQLAALKAAFEQEDADLKISQKSFDTDKIAEADRRQDKLYNTLKKAVRSFLDDDDAETAEAAKTLNQLFTDYGIATTMQLDREAGLMFNLCKDHKEKCPAQLATLGLTVMANKLSAANAEVMSLLEQRSKENSTKVAGALKKSRAAVDEAMRDFIQYVNAAAVIFGVADYEAYIDFANTDIARIKREALGKKSSTASAGTPSAGTGTESGGETTE